jgi:hypothetical protein
MPLTPFDKYKALFDADKMEALAASREGLLWLKVKSITRTKLLDDFSRFADIPLEGKIQEKSTALFAALLPDIERGHDRLNRFIKTSESPYSQEKLNAIAAELHKMRHFSWGGDYANALDKFLVDRYVKKISSFSEIAGKLAVEIPQAVGGYVLCSWYNHWSTILIENIFKRHDKVLPAIGGVKKVDFFIDDVPFDLKTTYLPENFIAQKRKDAGLRSELAELKRAAKENAIAFDEKARARDVAGEIAEKIKIRGGAESRQVLRDIRNFRRRLICACVANPAALIKNLYEQQGAMRFDASNRLFVVLADTNDFENSWKLKRHPDLLEESIYAYLDSFSKERIGKMRLTFTHKARSGEFSAVSDAIFIITE